MLKTLGIAGAVLRPDAQATASAFARAGDRTLRATPTRSPAALCVKAHAGTLRPKLRAAGRSCRDRLRHAGERVRAARLNGRRRPRRTVLSTVVSTQNGPGHGCMPEAGHRTDAACASRRVARAQSTIATARRREQTAVDRLPHGGRGQPGRRSGARSSRARAEPPRHRRGGASAARAGRARAGARIALLRSVPMTRIVTLPGDGIGPEVMAAGLEVLPRSARSRSRSTLRRRLDRRPRRRADRRGAGRVPRRRRGAARRRRRAEVGHHRPATPRPEQGLLGVRKGLGLFANLRPVRAIEALHDASPLREERIAGTDLLVVRELTGGIYFGAKTRTPTRRSDLCEYSVAEIERIARVAFAAARSARDERRQGQRARDLAAVARGRDARPRRGVSRTSSSTHLLVDNAAMGSSARRAAST